VGGKTLRRSIEVKADPRTSETQAQFDESFLLSEHCTDQYSIVDTMLNNLDSVARRLTDASASAKKAGNAALVAQLSMVSADETRAHEFLSSDFQGPEDYILRPGALREDLQYFLNGSPTIVTPAFRELENDVDHHFGQGVARYNHFVAGLPAIDAALKTAGQAPLPDIKHIVQGGTSGRTASRSQQ